MRSIKFFLFIFSLSASLSVKAQDATALVDKVKAKLNKVNDYKADGRMRLDVSFIDMPPSNVTVYFKKPDKFKVKKDGGISVLPKGGVSINLGSLLGQGEFDIVPRKDTVMNGLTTKVVKLLPVNEDGDLDLVTLYIDEKNAVIKKAAVSTHESGNYEIELSYGKYIDWGLPDKAVFIFNTSEYKLPKGITFEYEKGGKKKEIPKNKKGKVEITYSSYTINKGVDDAVFSK